MFSLKILLLHESLTLMEKCGIHNRILLSFLLILIISSSLASECRKPEPDETHQSKDIYGSSACEEVRVGLVLDMGSMDGKVVQSSITMALSDFYRANRGYKARVSVLTRDSHGEPLLALAAAVDLLQTAEVEAIIGAQSLIEAKFLAELAEKAKVPMISLHVPSSLTLRKYNHFIQATHDETSEAKGIATFIHSFDWDSVVLIYEDDDDWRESMQVLMEHFQGNGIHIVQKRAFLVSFGEDYIVEQLQMFKEIEAMVFIVHVSEKLASYLFPCAGRLGMMEEGYAWILTAKSMNHLHYTDYFVKESMEGVVGFKPYISMSKELYSFTSRWRISLPIEEGGVEIKELGVFGMRAHDIAWVLAEAAEIARLRGLKTHHLGSANTKVSPNVSALLDAITQSRFKGLSGDILFVDKKLFSETFEIVNIIGMGERRLGFWASGRFSNRRHWSSTHELGTIIWPGGFAKTPNGRSLRDSGKKKLRVLVTSSNRFPQLMDVYNDSKTGRINAKGFCIDVFLTSIAPFNYELEYIPWHGGSNYDDLAYAVYSQKDKYDAAVGDITITANRSSYIDFTLPFSDMGLGVVAAKDKSLWIFLKPLTPLLWLTSAFFFAFTGIVVWLIERPVNAEFQGSWSQQVGVMLWFGFSTLVYAHKERLQSNLSRFVVIVWVFAVLILISNYTATLTSMMTVQHMQFKSNQNYIGYLYGSSVAGLVLNSSNFQDTRPEGLNKSEDFANALLSGNVSFIIDEVPYLKVLLGDHHNDFDMVKTEMITNGFGFMFQKGSPLAWKVSQEIAKLRTTGRLTDIENRWFLKQASYINDDKYDPLTVYKFRGLFMITGVSWAIALTTLLIHWLREKRPVLKKLFDLLVNHRLWSFRNLMARTLHPAPRAIAGTPNRETANEIQMVPPN